MSTLVFITMLILILHRQFAYPDLLVHRAIKRLAIEVARHREAA